MSTALSIYSVKDNISNRFCGKSKTKQKNKDAPKLEHVCNINIYSKPIGDLRSELFSGTCI